MRHIYSVMTTVILCCIISVQMKAQNTTLPVGTIPGNADVTNMGAAAYNIPIEVVPGTHSVQPNLSVIYMANVGILGNQWDLVGLSAITRVGQNQFLDTRSSSVALDYSDRFALDGNRLVCNDPVDYGQNGTLYRPEFEDFSKIYSYGTVGNGPQYFKVFRDDGSVVEYGNTSDSRQLLGNTVLNWFINKITDINGNYMTFTYGYSGNEVWIEHIDYTGNTAAGLEPYARVYFTYNTNTHIGSTFVAGYEIPQTRLLRSITVQYKDGANYEMVRQYLFYYSDNFPKRLVGVKLKGSDGSELNPTVIEWNGSTFNDNISTSSFPVQSFNGNVGHIAVDFNKDSLCDIIEYNLNYWTPFFMQDNVIVPSGLNYSTTTSWNIKSCLPADIDGDGFSEIVTVCEHYYDHRLLVDVTNQTMQSNHIIQPFDSSSYGGVVTGDFLGNGKHQIVIMYDYQNGTFIKFASNDYNITQSLASGVMEVMDFDGDGKMELAVSTGQHLIIYKFEPLDESFNIVASIDIDGGFIASGDFNGDGISDILYRNGYYYIALGNGKTFSPVSTTVVFNHYMSNYNISPSVLDINNDGYDDVITFNNQSGDMKAICYLCCGYYDNKISFQNPIPVVSSPVVLTQSELNNQYNFTFGDFNNDHHVDLVASKSINSLYDGILLYELKMDKRVPQVQKVTAGDGSFVRWMYHDIYGLYYRYASHISILPYQYNVVESMTNSLGTTTQTNTHQYSFERPTYSFKRQQRMGFLVTSVTDVNRHATDSLFYEIMTGENHLVQDLIMPVRQKTYVYGQLFRSVGYMPICLTFSNNQRRYPFVCQTNDTNRLDMTVTKTLELRFPFGRKTSDQQTVKNANDFYPQFTTQSDYHFTTHALSSGGVITTMDSIKRNSRMNNSSIYSVQKQYFTYNNRYLPEQITVVMDGVSTSKTIQNYDYFGNGRLVTESGDSCLSISITSSYDNTGRFCVFESSGPSFNISRTFSPNKGLLLSITDENNLTTTYAYDVFDKLTAVHHPDGNTDTIRYGWYVYDEIPNAKYYSLTRMPGKSFDTERYYDLLGRNICTRENGFFTDTCYDIKGNVYRVSAPYIRGTSDANKIWHTFQYDQFGRTTSEVGPYSNVSYQYAGYTTTITDNLRQTASTRTTDAVGRVISVMDPGGTITFNYSPVLHDGRTATQTNVMACGHTSQIIADASGNRLCIVEPNAGTVTCRFNAHNQPLQQTDANGNIIRFQYDEWGRLTRKTNITPSNAISEVFRYTYDHYNSSNRGNGKLYRVLRNDTLCEQYTYDTLSLLAQHIRYVEGVSYSETYAYNTYGQLATLTYPDGFATRFTYNGKGQLSQIDQGSNSSLIFLAQSYNLYGQPLKCRFGNGTATEYEYNSSGLLTRINTGKIAGSTPVKPPLVLMNTMSLNTLNTVPDVIIDDEIYTVDSSIQNFHYTYDNKGRLVQRDQKNSQYETFQYDNLDRLVSFTQGTFNGVSQTFSTNKPHAVTKVTPTTNFPNAISADSCETDYNVFNQPSRIREGDVEILLKYGHDGQREKAVFKRNGVVERTRYYISANYEKEVDATGVTTHYNYVYGATGLAAICVRRNGVDSMYYVHQ